MLIELEIVFKFRVDFILSLNYTSLPVASGVISKTENIAFTIKASRLNLLGITIKATK